MDKEDVARVYNGILLSHKNNEIELFVVSWMDLESVKQSEVSQNKKKKIPYANTYIWNLKKKKNWFWRTRGRMGIKTQTY